MSTASHRLRFYLLSFLRHDFRASITVFFVALLLCLGISLACGAPVYSGLVAGIIGGLVVSLLSGSELSVSGPAAGLTAICATAIVELGSIETFFLAVAIAGVVQILLGVFRLGGFTQFIPSAVIKGMLAAIGIILISKQIPLLIGYGAPDFWTNELFNIATLDHAFSHVQSIYMHANLGVVVITLTSFAVLILWHRFASKRVGFIPTSFVTVMWGVMLGMLFDVALPRLQLDRSQFVNVPANVFASIKLPDVTNVIHSYAVWKTALVICFVASLETLLSITAIDKLDPQHRVTPQNRELVAQGTANLLSGLLGGLPITAVIVRSSANAEAGARSRLSGFFHGVWLLLALVTAVSLVNRIPYCVLAVILVRTGYNLAKPTMIRAVYKLGREQFLPFAVTVVAVLLSDLLIGVAVGIVFSVYFLVKHTYRAGFVVKEKLDGHTRHYKIDLALNVSFLNKQRVLDLLDKIPEYSIVEVDGTDSVYIDHDVLEIFAEFKAKARRKHIELVLKDVPEVQTIGVH